MGLLDGKDKMEHPSYGMVQFSRIHGGRTRNLFGSAVRTHMSTIVLRISLASMYHNLHQDKAYSKLDDQLIEVEMSAAQFAELLTTMNVGSGVPCTIKQVNGKRVPEPVDEEIEIDRVQHSFRKKLSGMVKTLREKSKEMESLLDKPRLKKEEKEKVQGIVNKVLQEVEANLPFVVDQFNEATERVVTAAKSEVDAFVTSVVQTTGLKQLQAMQEAVNAPVTKLIVEPEENE